MIFDLCSLPFPHALAAAGAARTAEEARAQGRRPAAVRQSIGARRVDDEECEWNIDYFHDISLETG